MLLIPPAFYSEMSRRSPLIISSCFLVSCCSTEANVVHSLGAGQKCFVIMEKSDHHLVELVLLHNGFDMLCGIVHIHFFTGT